MPLLTPKSETDRRLRALRDALTKGGVDAAVVVQNADLFYFTGSVQQGLLVVPAAHDAVYFVRRSAERASSESPLPVVPITSPKDVTAYFASRGITFRKVGFELDVLPVATFNRFAAIFPGSEAVDASLAIRTIRSVKSAHELAIHRANGRDLASVVSSARELVFAGTTDTTISATVLGRSTALGHNGATKMRAFNQDVGGPCVIAGPDAASVSFADVPTSGAGASTFLPMGASGHVLRDGDAVIVDLLFSRDGYLCDMTRTYSVGSLAGTLADALKVSEEVHKAVAEAAKPGVRSGALYDLALAVAAKSPFGPNFLGAPGSNVKFVGHGLGIEVDEFPFLAKGQETELVPGMVFACEPKFVFPGLGAVGIEDSFVVTERGVEKITVAKTQG